MEHPKAIGDRSTLAIMLALQEAGIPFYVPFGENTRCDLVVDEGEGLARVQCKTGRLRQGAIRFSACSSYAHHPNPKVVRRDYLGQIDYFAVYCPETTGVYLVPITEAQLRKQGTLRIEPTRNQEKRRVRLASRFEIGRVTSTPAPAAKPGAGGSCA